VNIKTTLKTSVAAAALFAMAAPIATPTADAGNVTSGKKNSLSISGYVTKSIMYADDGNSEQLFILDGGTSESRIRWVAKGTLNENVTAGAMIELEIPLSNQQDLATLGSTVGGGSDAVGTVGAWGIRHQFVWVKHKKMGKLSLGQTNAANNGGAEASLSGTTSVDLSGGANFAEGIAFIEKSGGANALSSSAFTVGGVSNNFDATSRTDVIRYDLPKFGGLNLAVSLNGGGGTEIGAKFSQKFGGVKFLAKGGFSQISQTSGTRESIWTASFAALHDSGLNASIAFSGANLKSGSGRKDPDNFYAAIGYQAKVLGVGKTNINIIYNNTEDLLATGDDYEAKGFTILQKLDPIGAYVAIAYRNYEFDQPGKSYDDIDAVFFTTLFNF
jgi:hypothetical protein